MFKFGIRRVVGDSMSPYLKADGFIFVRGSRKYMPGEVVGIRFDNQIIIKRIAKIKGDLVYVLGDNPSNSLDSRKFGWINRENIVFKLFFRF